MTAELAAILFGFAVLPALCVAIERLWPSNPGRPLLRRGLGSDVVWYFAQTFVSRTIAPWIVYFALLPWLPTEQTRTEAYFAGFGPIAAIPFGWQVFLVFVLADFLSYWQHRLFHCRGAWRIHAVHHSSRELDWLSATRFHPLNEIGAQLVYATPLLLVGFSPLAFVALVPFTATYAVFLHANVPWRFGPLRYVLASPVFHQWHHTTGAEGRDRNFAGFLPVWDWMFGTLYLPDDRMPREFGIEDPVPDGFLGQMIYPIAVPRSLSTADERATRRERESG